MEIREMFGHVEEAVPVQPWLMSHYWSALQKMIKFILVPASNLVSHETIEFILTEKQTEHNWNEQEHKHPETTTVEESRVHLSCSFG